MAFSSYIADAACEFCGHHERYSGDHTCVHCNRVRASFNSAGKQPQELAHPAIHRRIEAVAMKNVNYGDGV